MTTASFIFSHTPTNLFLSATILSLLLLLLLLLNYIVVIYYTLLSIIAGRVFLDSAGTFFYVTFEPLAVLSLGISSFLLVTLAINTVIFLRFTNTILA